MRHFELSTDIAAPAERVWEALVTLPDWPRWNRLVPQGDGVVAVGEQLSFRIRVSPRDVVPPSFRPHRPTVLVVDRRATLVLEASFGARWMVHMVHSFFVEPTPEGCRLRQTWETSGVLVPLLWPRLLAAQQGFSEFGEDLGRYVREAQGPGINTT